jgi:hypothetical protein
LIKYASLSKDSSIDAFQRSRKEAAINFLMIDINLGGDADADHQEVYIRKIQPSGEVKSFNSPEDYKNELEWTMNKPKDNEYGTILLMPGTKDDTEFVVDGFDLDSPHAWKRRF